ncbi:unnamed protein product [Nesidiocoris tenuis]|uniref:Retrotransposon Copia-like N-terminal domain-containing protein n=3 Tax=Nesidiocoris tenuis TaxID=355587 RepID=A0A6H5H5L5_9HEMI|nr:unnamed protein product [Nesidiocoris tenuis]
MSIQKIDSLTRENYDTWKVLMEALLEKTDGIGYVNGEIVRPGIPVEGGTITPEVRQTAETNATKWDSADRKVRADIILAISPSEIKQVKDCRTSRELWLKLESIYESKGPARKASLLKKLMLHKMQEDHDVRDHISQFFDAVDKLQSMGVDIHPDLLTIMLLYSLPESFENFRCAIE